MSADIVHRSISFLESSLKQSQKISLALGISLFVSLVGNGIQLFFQPKPEIIGMTQNMDVLKITALEEPMINEPALKSWLVSALTDSLNMDFLNWQERLLNARQYFSKDAFTGFATSLDSGGNIPLLKQHRAILHAVVTGAPLLNYAGKYKGVMTWDFDVPMLLNFETSAQRIQSQKIIVTVRVQRVDTREYPRGVAIVQIITTADKRRS